MDKQLLRRISLFLALVVMFQMTGILDISAHALEKPNNAYFVKNSEAPSEPIIIGEDISKREENIKHFKLSDGSWVAASYPGPVHYQAENGSWEEIDNTFHTTATAFRIPSAAMANNETIADSTAIQAEESLNASTPIEITETSLVNKSNSFAVSLPNNLNEQSWVGVFHDGYSLCFRFENIEGADAYIVTPDAQGAEISNELDDAFASNTYSSVAYKNILPGISVIYELIGQELKENILFDQLSNVPDTLSFVICAEDLEMEEQEDGTFIFLANNEPYFSIPAPFMMDSEGESSGIVNVTIEEISEDTFRFVYTPDQEWLQSADRVWPVILDPVTCAKTTRQTILDTYTRSGYPTYNYINAYYIYAGYYSSPTKNVRGFIKHTAPPTLGSGDVVVKAQLTARGKIFNGTGPVRVSAHAVTKSWGKSTTWKNQPTAESEILDVQLIDTKTMKVYTWDITSAAQRWYSGDLAGKGKLANNGIMLMAPDDENTGVKHTAQFNAVDGSGYWPQLLIYYRNSTGIESYWDYTNTDAGRAGTVFVNDYTGNLVVSRSDMSYAGNRLPASMVFTYNANDKNINIGYGNGWRSNYSQTVVLQTIAGNNYYCWTDGDGTRIYFYSDEGVWKDENGLEYTLNVGDSDYTISDKDSNQLVFDANGRLSTVIDGKISNNKIQIAYVSGVTTPKISTITDGSGRKYAFAYGSDGNLSSITYTGTGTASLEAVTYTYSSNDLTKVTYADSNTATYEYSNGYLINAIGCQNDSVAISYGTGGTTKVKQVVTKDAATTVSSASFIYGDNYTKVTDDINERWCIYQFNNMGNTVSVYNQQGQALYGTYSDETPNQLVNSSRLQDTVTNLLSTRTYTSAFNQSVTVTAGKSYTLSGTGTGKLTLAAGSVTAESPMVTDGRAEVTISVPSGSTSVTISGSGAFSNLQLEQTESASRYNLLYDADMTSVTNWTDTNIESDDGHSTAETSSRAHLDNYALRIGGKSTLAKQYTQTISVSGANGDNYSFGAWAKAASVPLDNINSQNKDTDPQRRFGIQVRLLNNDTVIAEKYLAANEACAEWQFISDSIQAKAAYDKVEFSLIYDYNANTAYFDGAQLFKENFAYIYTYDENGRIETVTDLDGNVTTYAYRGNSSDITSVELPGGAVYSYSYNDSNLLTGTTSATGIQTTHTYDSYGNNIQTTITHSGSGAVIQSNQTYTSDGNFLASVTGGDRNTVTYNYNTENSTLTSVTDPRGTTTSNTYDTMRRLKSVTSGGATASYTYNKDRLSSITHSGGANGTTYNFAYTTAGLTDTVSVGSAYTLVDNAYNSGTWTLASQTYGNEDAWHYTYNDFDDLVSAYTTGGSTGTELKYFYNSEGALARIEQYDTTLSGTSISSRTLVSTERYYYDTTDRMIRITRTDTDGDTYECSWVYDHNNNVTELVETINGTPTTTAYTYDADQRVVSMATGGTSTAYTYDGYGRIATQATKNGGAAVLTDTYAYRSPGTGLTSTQVEKLTVAASGLNVTYTYGYDANGNITSISDGTNTTTYEYDALNQLTRENNQAAGKSWVWTYDAGGNITSRTEYAYTTGALGTAADTVSYTYGDSAWGDLLTAYDGVTITHDDIGNPLNDGTWTYSWDGRQLASMTGSGTTWSYKYDADGLRTERSNGTKTYEYVYSGDSLVHMSVDSNLLYFTYDGSAPMTVTYNGTAYYYVTNLQGDVIAILDGSGNPVVQYTYDAWGKPLSTTGTLADTLGEANPLRYRGYVYDTETELYYVSSRYYDPEIGRWINADDTAYLGADGTPLSYNLFAYCKNNPVVGYDPSGTFDWGSLAQGGGWLATGIAALVVGVSVLTCGVATPLMVGVALATAGAGALTVANGASEISEAFTGYNVMRDGVFQGNATAYNAYAYSTAAVAQVGTAICGGWSAKNAPRIEAYNNIQNYKYADGAAKHIGQRSYYDSTLLQKQIIKYGSMTSEGNGVYTFRVAGSSFNVARQLMHQGTWELTTINSMKLIGHFLLDY